MNNTIQTFIEINESQWRILQAQKVSDRVILKRQDTINAIGRTPSEMEAALRRFFSPMGMRRSDVTVIFPRKKTIFKHMRLPSSDKREIAQMVGLQLVNQVPYASEEIVFAHSILRADADGHTHALAVVVPVVVMEEWLKPLKAVSLNISSVTVSSYATAAWFQMLARRKSLVSEKVHMVVNIDDHHAEACFCQGNVLLFSRHIPLGLMDIRQDGLRSFMEQMQWGMDLYRKEHVQSAFERIIFVSGAADLEDLKRMSGEKWNVDVDQVNPFDILNDKDKAFVAGLSPALSWTNVLGLLLNGEAGYPDISPKSFSVDYAARKRARQRWTAFGLLAVLLAGLAAWFLIETSVRSAYLRTLQNELDSVEPKAERMNKVIGHTRALDEYFARRVMIVDVMREIYKRTPEDVVFQALYGTASGEWIFQGYAQTRSSVNALQSGLIDSPLFDGVQLDYATKRRLGSVDVTDFKIRCRLSSEKERP